MADMFPMVQEIVSKVITQLRDINAKLDKLIEISERDNDG